MSRGCHILLVAGFLASTGMAAWGFALLGSKWATRNVTMQLQLGSGGLLIDGSSTWDASAEAALAIWNKSLANLQFLVVRNSSAPIGDGNGVNNVLFDDTVYGFSFAGAVAITTEWTENGGRTRTEADVIFNSNLSWNSYRGDLQRTGGGATLYDLRRVALHEFGHVLGLDHPDERGQSVNAIMNSRVSDVDSLLPDDIRGGQALYGAAASSSAAAAFTRPSTATVRTSASFYRFRGRADSSRSTAVYLTNSKNGVRRYLKASGISRWKRTVLLEPGRNVVRLYVARPGGSRMKVAQRVIIRQGD